MIGRLHNCKKTEITTWFQTKITHKSPSELTEGEVDTSLHFSVSKRLGSSASGLELLEAPSLTASRTLEQIVFAGKSYFFKYKN
jgi:hypothetical protein